MSPSRGSKRLGRRKSLETQKEKKEENQNGTSPSSSSPTPKDNKLPKFPQEQFKFTDDEKAEIEKQKKYYEDLDKYLFFCVICV